MAKGTGNPMAQGRTLPPSGRLGKWALKILKAVYGGALNATEVSEAIGLSLSETINVSKGLVRHGLLCALDGEDWCLRDETRTIPELAKMRGIKCTPSKEKPTRDRGRWPQRRVA